MPAIIPFIPLIAAGVGAGATVYAAKKSASTAERLARPVEAAGQAQTEQARQQFGLGSPAVRQAMSYYQTLLTGSRGQMQQLTAGPRGAITDVYSSAARGLERSGVRRERAVPAARQSLCSKALIRPQQSDPMVHLKKISEPQPTSLECP